MRDKLLKKLPKVDYILEDKRLKKYKEELNYHTFLDCIKSGIDYFRQKVLQDEIKYFSLDDIILKIEEIIKTKSLYNLRKIINGTGVILHTNFGRAIFSEKMAKHLYDTVISYNNLEYDIEKGERGSRYSHIEKLMCDITGAEGALIVNNNAAAVLLCVSEFSRQKEVIISRGEIVEIGGNFRIPDIIKFAGASLKEVGTTNRTYLKDYEVEINENTGIILKVHTSNYKINGFTKEVESSEIVKLAKSQNIISMEDLGSGTFIDFSKYGLRKEKTVREVVKSGMDIVTFSGDKLFGGCQAGIIVGKKPLIERLKKNQYLRTVRADKMQIAVIENILRMYQDEREVIKNIPTLKMITENISEVEKRAKRLSEIISKRNIPHRIIQTEASIGGGAMPEEIIKSFGIVFESKISPVELEKKFRKSEIAVIGRIYKDNFIIDMKTVDEKDISLLGKIICENLGE